jgi:two-component system, sensor histidine kinase LadS
MEPAEAYLSDSRLEVFQIIYLGVLLGALLLAIGSMTVNGDALIGWFIAALVTYFAYSFCVMGFLGRIVPPDLAPAVTRLTREVVCLTVLVWLLFHRAFVARFRPRPLPYRALDALIALDTLAFLVTLHGEVILGLRINDLVILTGGPLLPLISGTARRDAVFSRTVLTTAYAVQALSLFVASAPTLGFAWLSEWSLAANRSYGLISTGLVFTAIYRYARQRNQEALETTLQLRVTQQTLEQERGWFEKRNRFMSMLTHELKTPLSVIKLSLRRLGADEATRRRVDRALDDINAIIERCGLSDQMEQRRLRVEIAEVDVTAAVREAIQDRAASQRIATHLEPGLVITSDSRLVRVVLNNLLDNAMKYGALGGPITVTAQTRDRADRPGVLITVRNPPGRAGFPDPGQLFDKYYRGPGAHGKSGSGLGLYIVRGIVDDMLGGQIHYMAEDGDIRFEVWLPC